MILDPIVVTPTILFGQQIDHYKFSFFPAYNQCMVGAEILINVTVVLTVYFAVRTY